MLGGFRGFLVRGGSTLPSRGEYCFTLGLPRSLGGTVVALMGALPQLPFLLLLKGLDRRISQVLGVKLGTGPQTFCSGYSSWLAVALLCPRTLFFSPSQEEAFLGCLVYPNCFFEVSAVWGMERYMQGWDITLCAKTWAAVGWRVFGILSPVFLSCCFFSVGYSGDGGKATRGLFRVDFWFHWAVFGGIEDVGSDFWDGGGWNSPFSLHESFEK